MLIRTGYNIAFDLPAATAINFMLRVHPDRSGDLLRDDTIRLPSSLPASEFVDIFGNIVTRVMAPAGRLELSSDFLVQDSGQPDLLEPGAEQIAVERLPSQTLQFLVGSRYCDTQKLGDIAWAQFGSTKPGWDRVQAICDYVHDRINFGYNFARSDRTASEGHNEQVGVCRDFAHLAVALCRCMNIPARYCTGYLGDIGVPKDPAPMDFSAWFEVFLGGKWYTFDARHNVPRIGRIVIARGRDAADVAISTSFGPSWLSRFEVHTDEVIDEGNVATLVPKSDTGQVTALRQIA